MTCKVIIAGLVTGAVIATAMQCSKAHAIDISVTREVPTVLGIPQGAAPHEYYDARRPIVGTRPRARIMHSPDAAGAPPNGCPVPAFRVVSGPKAERGCYGAL